MSTRFLSSEEKAIGVKHHYHHQQFNGAGFNFLGDTPVYLLAIQFGATNTQLGYISSTIYITGILLSVIPRIFSGHNMVKLYFWGWILRGIICLGYSALFFMHGKSAVYLIMGIYTMFCVCRTVGVVVYSPIIKMITTNINRGEILSTSSIHFQWPLSISRFISFLVTSVRQLSGTTGILVLQWLGVILNTLAAFQLRKIPCRQNIEYTPGRGVFRILLEAVKYREFRYCLFLSWTNTSLLIIFGFIIPFLRKDAGLSQNLIFIYTLTAGIASITGGLYSQGFADRIGSRPILLGSTLLLSLCTMLWIVTPVDSGIIFYFIFGFLTTFALYVNMIMINRLVVRALPENDAVSYSTMLNFFVGFISFLVGLCAGTLADLPNISGLNLPNSYSLTFMMAMLFCGLTLVFTYKTKDDGSLSTREAASIMFSITNLASFQRISQLRKTENPVEKRALLLNLGNDNTIMAEEELRNYLHNPLSVDKEEALLSLFSNPRPRLLPQILAEADDRDSYQRVQAIFALGAYPGEESEKLLISLLDDPEPSIRSNAAKSLGRIGSNSCLEKVRQNARVSTGIWDHLNYTIALKHMDKEGRFLKDLFSVEISERNISMIQAHYSLNAKLQDFLPSLAYIFQSRNLSQGQGLQDFLDEARDDEGFLESHMDFMRWFEKGKFEKIWNRCRNLLSEKMPSAYFDNMKNSIMEFPSEEAGYDDTLAVVYFTYQLIKTDPDKESVPLPN